MGCQDNFSAYNAHPLTQQTPQGFSGISEVKNFSEKKFEKVFDSSN